MSVSNIQIIRIADALEGLLALANEWTEAHRTRVVYRQDGGVETVAAGPLPPRKDPT